MTAIEPATLDDVDRVTELWIRLADGQREFGSRLRAAENREMVRNAMARHAVDNTLFVARDPAGRVIGFVSFDVPEEGLERTVERGRIQNLFVEAEERGRGIGSRLLERARDALEAAGVETIVIEAMVENEGAKRLYQQHGFEPHRVEFEYRVDDGDDGSESDTHSKQDG